MAKERLSLPLARALRSTLAASPWFMPHCRQSGLLCSSAHLLISRLQASLFLLPSPLLSYYTYIVLLNNVSHFPDDLFIFIFLIGSSDYMISINLHSNSLILLPIQIYC